MLRFLCTALMSVSLIPYSYAQKSILLKNGHVVDVEQGKILQQTDVLIEGERIVKVMPNISADQANTTIFDLKGKYIVPGMIDMHVHLPGPEGEDIPMKDFMRMSLASGITSIRSMRGHADQLPIQDSVRKGFLMGPSMYLASPAFREDSAHVLFKDIPTAIERYKSQGFQYIKYLSGKTPGYYDSVYKYAQLANMPLVGHAPPGGLKQAAIQSPLSVEHIDALLAVYLKDPAQFTSLMKACEEKNVFFCPDVYWYLVTYQVLPLHYLQKKPGLSQLPPAIVEDWSNRYTKVKARMSPTDYTAMQTKWQKQIDATLKMLKAMNAEGIKLLISPGDGEFIIPGNSYYDELYYFKLAGIPSADILKAATINAAQALHDDANIGSIKEGKYADILVVKDNPLQNIIAMVYPQMVIVRNRYISASGELADVLQ
ncbi:imidazolonepropionase-like amidohydrolase [Chitinophaga skermanii]|uniref:Imidazolonepropionase-like amidohydrolase n=1 Tax=Chitinophaga skermanii TaxID=331697 RepID=A0A327QV25_9BACT|nr:amidohydrolase family protein [Chitinophaga skermanii]RAJ08536.1 imidazolonepropionase-like amidohydrolase [Chitinophaga skermanii]